MSENEKLLKEVTASLRSVLLSTQDGLSTRKLLADYEDLVCSELPFRQLGYRTPEDFFLTLPHVVRGIRCGGITVWHGVSDKNTAHITELVSRQRPKSSRRPGGGRPLPSYMQSAYSRPPSLSFPSRISSLLTIQAPTAYPPRVPPTSVYSPRVPPTSVYSPRIPPTSVYSPRVSPTSVNPTRGPPTSVNPPRVPPTSVNPPRVPPTSVNPPRVPSTSVNPPRVPPTSVNPPKLPAETPMLKIEMQRLTRELKHHFPAKPKVKEVPEQLKSQIELLLASYPAGIKMSDFSERYTNYFHQYLLPEEFGYINVNDFVLSMSDVVKVRNTGRELLLFSVKSTDSNQKKTEFSYDDGWKVVNGRHANRSVDSDGWPLESKKQSQKANMQNSKMDLKEDNNDFKYNLAINSDNKQEIKQNLTFNSKMKHFQIEDKLPDRTHSQIKQVKTENNSYDDWSPNSIKKPSRDNYVISHNGAEGKENKNINSHEILDDYKQVKAFTKQAAKADKSWDDSEILDNPNCAVSKRLKMEFRQLLEKYPKEIKSNFLPKFYEKEFGKELDYQGLGYISLTDLIFEIPDVFFPFRESPNCDYLLLDARACKKYGCPSYTATGNNSKKIPEVIKKAVVKLLYNNPKGILVRDFPAEYKNYFNRIIPYEDYGFYNVRDFLDVLANDTIDLDETINGTLARLRPDSLHKYLPALGGKPELAVLNLLPNDFVQLGEDIPVQALSEKSDDSYFEIIPSDITSPDEFYFYLRGKNTSMALDKLMDNLDFYHTKEGSDYIVPPDYFQTDQICASLYNNKDWHRAKILKVDEDDVTVFYLDYGTVDKALKSNLRLLRRRYAILPAQAIEAKLWDVKPALSPQWSKKARARFYELMVDKTLQAKLMGRKRKPISKVLLLGLWLVDTCTPDGKELHINKVLVDEGHACYFNESNEMAGGVTDDVSAQYQMLNMYNPAMLSPIPMQNMIELQAAYNNMCAMMLNCNSLLPQMYNQTMPAAPTKTQSTKTQTVTATTMTQSDPAPEASAAASKPTKVEIEVPEIVSEPIMAKNNSGLDNLGDLLEELSVKRLVKVVTICSLTVHLILFNKELYVMAKEISQFLWPRDLLRIKLRLHHLKIPKVMINEDDCPELFSELLTYDVCEAPLEPGQPHALNIYPFRRVPEIIDKFNPDLIQVKAAIIQELDRFDPNDTYWGNSDDGISMGEPWDLLDEVELGLQVIKSRKTAIELELLGGIKQPLVDELNFLKGRILLLESGKFK